MAWYTKVSYEYPVAPYCQGLVIDEETGANIAVTYNDFEGRNARLIAATPDMLDLVTLIMTDWEGGNPDKGNVDYYRLARDIVDKVRP